MMDLYLDFHSLTLMEILKDWPMGIHLVTMMEIG
jgi:hypothetical protein